MLSIFTSSYSLRQSDTALKIFRINVQFVEVSWEKRDRIQSDKSPESCWLLRKVYCEWAGVCPGCRKKRCFSDANHTFPEVMLQALSLLAGELFSLAHTRWAALLKQHTARPERPLFLTLLHSLLMQYAPPGSREKNSKENGKTLCLKTEDNNNKAIMLVLSELAWTAVF